MEFSFCPVKKAHLHFKSCSSGNHTKLPNFKPRRAGYESVYYGINNTRATRT